MGDLQWEVMANQNIASSILSKRKQNQLKG